MDRPNGVGTADWWTRSKWLRYAYGAGLICGVILGWMFHGIISFAFRFAVVVVVVLLFVALFFLWRRLTARDRAPVQVVTWRLTDQPSRREDER